MAEDADRFVDFCARVGLELEPFQRRLARLLLGPQPEALVLLPRGNGKSALLGAYAVHHLLTVPQASVFIAAASREQASVIHGFARSFAEAAGAGRKASGGGLILRHLEIRAPDGGRLNVLASDAPKLHGLTPSLAVVDELHAHRDAEVYIALRTAIIKRPGARMVTLSTAGQGEDSPLGRLRARALAQPSVKRTGAVVEARGPELAMLEWSVPDDQADDLDAYAKANPASWITRAALAGQQAALPPLAFARYHGNVWTAREGAWLHPGAWQACIDPTMTIDPGEPVYVGVDAGGDRAATAVVWATQDGRVGAWIGHGDQALLEAIDVIRDLAEEFTVREVVYDPWRMQQAALELERDGLTVVTFPQSDARMVPASGALHQAIVEQRLRLPVEPVELHRHAQNAVQRHTRRGWRLESPGRSVQIDALIALAMAVDRASAPVPEPVRLIGWL